MTNEKLIEEAARAIAAFTDPEAWTAFRGQAEAALAVFEKAHTQTDDEREALEAALSYLDDLIRDRQIWYDDYSSLHDLVSSALSAADFRRTEAPEPSVECPQCHRADGQHKLGCGERFGAEPQGEPSGAQVQAALDAYFDPEKPKWRGELAGRMRAALRAARGVR